VRRAVSRVAVDCAGLCFPRSPSEVGSIRAGEPARKNATTRRSRAQSVKNGNWALVGIGWPAKVRVIEIGIGAAAQRTGQSARENGVRFCLAVAEIRVIAAGAAKSVAGDEAVFGPTAQSSQN